MKTKFLFLPAFFLILTSCSSSDESPEVLSPTPATLVFPAKNTECNEGIVVDADKSRVNFQWEMSENTTSYELFIEDLQSNVLHQESTPNTELEITIARGNAFRWYVQSKSEATEEMATSEVWSFYNAGEGITSHVPFPAEITSPVSGETFSADTSTLTLEWEGSDLDEDILEYNVYLGEVNPPENVEGTTSIEEMEVNVASGRTYYWFIKTIDDVGNSSNSSIFHFTLE